MPMPIILFWRLPNTRPISFSGTRSRIQELHAQARNAPATYRSEKAMAISSKAISGIGQQRGDGDHEQHGARDEPGVLIDRAPHPHVFDGEQRGHLCKLGDMGNGSQHADHQVAGTEFHGQRREKGADRQRFP